MLQRETNFKTGRKGRWQIMPALSGVALLLLMAVAVAPIQASLVYAEGDGGVATFSGWLSSSVTLSMADKVEETIEPTVSGAFKNLSTVAHVQVNNSEYYDVKMHASSTDMTSAVNTDAKISSITAAANQGSFGRNQWGYSLIKNGAGVTTATPANAETVYQPVKTVATAVPGIGQQTTTNNAANDYYTMNFGAKVDTSLPAGTYSSTVTLSVVASPKLVTGFDRTDTMQGMTANICKEIGSDADTDKAKYETTDALGNKIYTKQLRDNRDGKYYWVAKLADGNCWMTQNLALDIPAAGLTSELTALAPGKTSWRPQEGTRTPATPNRFTISECPAQAEGVTQGIYGEGKKYASEMTCLSTNADYSWNEGKYVMIYPGEGNRGLWIGMKPKEDGIDRDNNGTVQDGLKSFTDKTEIIGQSIEDRKNPTELEGLKGSKVLTDYGVVMDVSDGWTASTDPNFTEGSTYIANDGKTVVTKTPVNTGAGEITEGLAIDYGRKVYDAHYLIGNYYQWLAATAQTVAEGLAVAEAGAKVTGSICAKNWELPTSGSYGTDTSATGPTYNAANNSFFNLINRTSDKALITTGTSGNNSAQVNNGYSVLSNVIKGEGDTAVTTESILAGSPMHFLRAGYVIHGSRHQQVWSVGEGGAYWSSVAASTVDARRFDFNPLRVSPSYANDRAYGFSARCLLNTTE